MNTSVQIVGISVLRYIPELVAWLFGIVLAVLMVKRGGGKTEKMLLAGCCLLFAAQLISLSLSGMIPWLREQSMSAQQLGLTLSISGIPSLAGFICLIIAFWTRFRVRRQEAA
jgi:hypothetical protein